MILGGFTLILFAFLISSSIVAGDNREVREFLASLQRSARIDWTRPPKVQTDSSKEKKCFRWWWRCNPTYFSLRKKLVPETALDYHGKKFLLEPNFTVFYNVTSHGGILNTGRDDMTLSLPRPSVFVDSTSIGWEIGAQISRRENERAHSPLWISGETLKPRQDSSARKDPYLVWASCKAGHSCRFETWTFHVKVSGHCEVRPNINCKGDLDPCLWRSLGCEQFDNYRAKHCPRTVGSPHRVEACTARALIVGVDQKPLTRLVQIMERTASSRGRAWRDNIYDNDEWTKSPMMATREGKSRWGPRVEMLFLT